MFIPLSADLYTSLTWVLLDPHQSGKVGFVLGTITLKNQHVPVSRQVVFCYYYVFINAVPLSQDFMKGYVLTRAHHGRVF
jgi:hypothetical protein